MNKPLNELNYMRPTSYPDSWYDIHGTSLRIAQMQSSYIMNCLTMVCRNGKLGFNARPLVFDRNYCTRKVEGMVLELATRGVILVNSCYNSVVIL